MTKESLHPFVIPPGAEVLGLDVDGVLVHPVTRGRKWDAEIRSDLGIDPESLGRGFFRKYWGEVVVGRRDLRETLAAFLKEIGSSVPVDDLVRYWFEKDGFVDTEVVNVVREWRERDPRRFVIAVSNQERYRVGYLTSTLGLSEILNGALWSCELGVVKSDPAFYELANRRYLSEAERVIFFDDEEKHVLLARDAGWHAYVFVDVAGLGSRLSAPVEH